MSLKAITAVAAWQLQANLKGCAFQLANYHNHETGQCNPSTAIMAAALKCSTRYVREMIGQLVELGVITRSAAFVNGRQVANNYDFCPPLGRNHRSSPPELAFLPGRNPNSPQEEPPFPLGEEPPFPPGAEPGFLRNQEEESGRRNQEDKTADTDFQQEILVTPTLCAARTAAIGGGPPEPAGFTRFWDAWPAGQRKRGRKNALAAWRSHHLESQANMIIADVIQRIHQDEQWERGYTPMPQTYLRGARWEDELAAPAEQVRPSPIMRGIAALEELKCQYRTPGSPPPSSPASRNLPP